MLKKLSSRKFKLGAYAAAVTAVLLVLIIALNVVSVLLTQRYNAFVDLTASRAFEVSDEIMDVFRSINTPMSVTVLYSEEEYNALNPYCAQVSHILSEAAACNDNISVRYVDPVKNPEISGSYPQMDCTQYDMIVENLDTGRCFEIPFSDLFFINNNSITASKAEAVIAARLVSMTSGSTFTVAFSTGHGESELQGFRDLLELNNYTVKNVNTVTEDLSDDILCLIIAGPSLDFSAEETKKIEQFLLNGGECGKSVLYFASLGNLDMPNIEGLLSGYGIGISDDIVIETNPNYVFGESTAYALSGYMEQEYAGKAYTENLFSISPYTRPLDLLFESSADTEVTPLMCFSTTSLAVNPNDPDKTRSGKDETFYSALVSRYHRYETGVGEKSSRVCVFGTVLFADDTMLATKSIGNAEYLVGVM
ncbi:MAG: GldG family protein, partial [Eubacteriales bacterium]|nr:GldG family protein [Eubacteriales bacterium]